jgi:hypothetical protein
MDLRIRDRFIGLWETFFPGAELPLVFQYAADIGEAAPVQPASRRRCFLIDLIKARRGETVCFNSRSIGCGGGQRYTGFSAALRPDFDLFLSCGLPGKFEGERYKRSPGLVREMMSAMPPFDAPGEFLLFKRWDRLAEGDAPEAAVFFAPADVLSGLFTLANFDEPTPNGVFSPFASGCASIVYHPFFENRAARPRAVLGMFDVTARPWVGRDILTLAIPMAKFSAMIDQAEESFLTTPSWDRVRKRLQKKASE